MRAQIRLASIACLAFALVSSNIRAQAQTFTVDDDGPADFASLAEAVQLVPEGSVLLIEPGSYGCLSIDRALTLLGRSNSPPPTLEELEVTGPGIKAQHLAIVGSGYAVQLTDVAGPVLLSDLTIDGSVSVSKCADLLIAHSSVLGSQADEYGYPGLWSSRSKLQLLDCRIEGGQGLASQVAGWGGRGLHLDRTQALVVDCDIFGGPGSPTPGAQGQGGVGVFCGDDSLLDLRGTKAHRIEGGPEAIGSSKKYHHGILMETTGRLHYGGPTIHGLAGWHIHESIPPRPFLLLSGDGSAGSLLTLSFHGRRDSLGMVVFSGRPANELHPAVAFVPAYVDFDFVLSNQLVVLQGNESPVQMSWTVPDAPFMAGRTLYMQGFQGHLGGWLVGTNVEHFTFGHR